MILMKHAILLALGVIAFGVGGIARAAVDVVTPSNMGDWSIYSTGVYSNTPGGTGTGDFVTGPATPPQGVGSAHFQPGDGDQSVQLRTTAFAGTRLDSLTSFGYSTYATAWNGQQLPYITLWVDWDNNGSYDDRLWFEPDYTSPAMLNTWQTWDLLAGNWYSDEIPGPGSNSYPLADYLAIHPDATITNDGTSGAGGFRIASGFASPGDTFNAYVDAVVFGDTTYDFEPGAAVPEAGSIAIWSVLGIALGSCTVWRRRRSAVVA